MKVPRLIIVWTVIKHLTATEASRVVWSRSMRASMAAEAVARELWPKERKVVRCLLFGGLKGW